MNFKPATNYQIATLLYGFNARDEVLLLERTQEPNRGRWSPPGGKLELGTGESPHQCACREAREEMGWVTGPADWQLTGIISEANCQGTTHWLMFLFELRQRVAGLPPPHAEGRFQFFPRADLGGLNLPQTDREQVWPWFWEYRGGFFMAHCDCHEDGRNEWRLEQARRAGQP